jgi:hypothetical protein
MELQALSRLIRRLQYQGKRPMAYMTISSADMTFRPMSGTEREFDWSNIVPIVLTLPLAIIIALFVVPFGLLYASLGFENAYGDPA